jgi:hypothetical protein
MRGNPQIIVRLEPSERDLFERARQANYRNAQQQARKYIIEGLRRDGLLPLDASDPPAPQAA